MTVIIPAYLRDDQDLKWLLEALQSVMDQTVQCQCIIIENGSSFLEETYGWFTICHSEKGLSKARNIGIYLCNTEFFFPLDANDWLPDNAIETVYNKRPAEGFVYGATMLFSGERGSGDQHFYEAKPYDFREVMKMVYFPNGALQRKADWEKVGGYREELPFLEDWDYWMTCGERGICGTAIPDTLYWYRQHANGIVGTNKKSQEWEDVKKLIQSYHKDIYRGVFPPMCCGNKAPAPSEYVAPSMSSIVPGQDGMVLLKYIGGNAGSMTWYGPITNTRYRVNGTNSTFYVDARDLVTESRKNPGFLEITEGGYPIFQQVTP